MPEVAHVVEMNAKSFLYPAEAEIFCNAHDRGIWKDRTKRRKIYELIYVDGNTCTEAAQAAEALEIHIGLTYNDVEWGKIFEFHPPKPLAFSPEYKQHFFSAGLWPHLNKMIFHAIQPMSDPSAIIVS